MKIVKLEDRNGIHRLHIDDGWIVDLPIWLEVKKGQRIQIRELAGGEKRYDTVEMNGFVIRSDKERCIASFGGLLAQLPYPKEVDEPVKLGLKW